MAETILDDLKITAQIAANFRCVMISFPVVLRSINQRFPLSILSKDPYASHKTREQVPGVTFFFLFFVFCFFFSDLRELGSWRAVGVVLPRHIKTNGIVNVCVNCLLPGTPLRLQCPNPPPSPQ